MLKKSILFLGFILAGGILLPGFVLGADRTSEIAANSSWVEIAPESKNISAYHNDRINDEKPKTNLARITVNFRKAGSNPAYQHTSDTVSFYLDTDAKDALGWVDLNDNGEYEGREDLSEMKHIAGSGYYVSGADLSQGSSVVLYLGSQKPGSYNARVYTAENGKRGELIGTASFQVADADIKVILTAHEQKGEKSLGGHRGDVSDPYKVNPGTGVPLRAGVYLNSRSLADMEVVFYRSHEGQEGTVIGQETSDEDDLSEIRYKDGQGGLSCFYAEVNGYVSNKVYINFVPEEAADVMAITPDNKKLVLNGTYDIEFALVDRYGNRIPGDVEEECRIEVTKVPSGSKYQNYSAYITVKNSGGLAVMQFNPDKAGSYEITCTLASGRRHDNVDLQVMQPGKAIDLEMAIKSGAVKMPAVRYADDDNDGVPDMTGGRLEVLVTDANGVEAVANNNAQYRVEYSYDKNRIYISNSGLITVLDKNYTGPVPVKVTEHNSKLTKTYNLPVAGSPVSIGHTVQIRGKKAEISLQYRDAQGNATVFKDKEAYSLSLPPGVGAYYVHNFNTAGQADFILIADDFGTYNITVKAEKTGIKKTFPVEFKEKSGKETTVQTPDSPGRSKVIMFIGNKTYIQDGISKVSEVPPFIKDGRTFVAVRPVAEAFGADIDWDAELQKVTLTKGDLTVRIQLGENKIEKIYKGQSLELNVDVPAFIQEGRTVLPFRAVGEAFGAQVDYDDVTRSVSYSL